MDGFERRKEKKKEGIRIAAIELFKVYGFNKVSISDIAHRAFVSHATIYNHFGDKEGLIRDVIKKEITDLMDRSREIIRGDLTFLEKMELIIASKAGLAGQYQGEIMKTAVNESPGIRQFINELWQNEIKQLMDELVEEGKKLGYIKKELSQQAILFYMEMIRNGAFASTEMLNRVKIDKKLARDLNNIFLFGLIDKRE